MKKVFRIRKSYSSPLVSGIAAVSSPPLPEFGSLPKRVKHLERRMLRLEEELDRRVPKKSRSHLAADWVVQYLARKHKHFYDDMYNLIEIPECSELAMTLLEDGRLAGFTPQALKGLRDPNDVEVLHAPGSKKWMWRLSLAARERLGLKPEFGALPKLEGGAIVKITSDLLDKTIRSVKFEIFDSEESVNRRPMRKRLEMITLLRAIIDAYLRLPEEKRLNPSESLKGAFSNIHDDLIRIKDGAEVVHWDDKVLDLIGACNRAGTKIRAPD